MKQIYSHTKKQIKRLLSRFVLSNTDKILSEIQNASVVSFDIFDTLIKRDVPSPADVHPLVGRRYLEQTGTEIADYQERRLHAEQNARKLANGREITLKDIFDCFLGLKEEEKSVLCELEMQTEYDVCCVNPYIKPVYDAAIASNKKIIITSDMYLPESVIRKILDKCGYCGYEKLYLSSSYGVTKASGQLYQHLLKEVKNSPKTIVHIGDNIKSDYFQAGQAGINPILIRDYVNTLRFHTTENLESFDAACFRAFLANHKPLGKDNRDEMAVAIGYEVLGPLLEGYCRWLKTQAKCRNIKKIFFLSREGSLLKRAYEELYPHHNETTAYLYVSRQALQVPMLLFCRDFNDMSSRIKPLMREHTLKAIGENCHLRTGYEENLSFLHLKPEDDVFQIPETVRENYFHLVQELGKDYYAEQYALVKEYLSGKGVHGAAILSDIGWHGTMQQALSEYCQDNVSLHGCYVGCWNPSSSKIYERLSRDGYLTTPEGDKEMELLLRFSCDIMETLLSNSEGSVMAYKVTENEVVPILRENELNSRNRTFIHQIQDYAMAFLQDINHSHIYSHADVPKEFVSAGLRHLLRNPSLQTIHCFKNYQFLDGTLRSVLPEHSIGWYIFHPRTLISDLDKSSCKLFFLKAVFKLPLPYFQILKFLREDLRIKSSNQKIWLERQK